MARPTKYSAALVSAILASLTHGATRTASAEAAGVAYDTFKGWYDAKADFNAAVRKAEAKAEMTLIKVVMDAIAGAVVEINTVTKTTTGPDGSTNTVKTVTEKRLGGDWTAAAWWLERRRSADYGVWRSKDGDKEPGDINIEKMIIGVDLDQI